MTQPPIDLTGGTDDAALLALVREAMRALDPVPPDVIAAARGSFAWLTIDADLAALVEDTAADPVGAGGSGVRSGDAARLLTFEGAEGDVVLVEVAKQGHRRRLTGQLVPARSVDVEVRRAAGSRRTRTDDLGRFAVDGLEPGPVSLACRVREGGPMLVTEWTSL